MKATLIVIQNKADFTEAKALVEALTGFRRCHGTATRSKRHLWGHRYTRLHRISFDANT